jgi:hypothetical protein
LPGLRLDGSTKTPTDFGVVACHAPLKSIGIVPITVSQLPALDAETINVIGAPLLLTSTVFGITPSAPLVTVKLKAVGETINEGFWPQPNPVISKNNVMVVFTN